MKDRIPSIPSKINLAGKEIPFDHIHREFSSTALGNVLAANARFSTRIPPGITNDGWKELLGADVNNLDHLVVTKELTTAFLKGCKNPTREWKGEIPEEAHFSPAEEQLLVFTAIVHDWGEAVYGDIFYYDKTEEDERKEMGPLREIIREVVGEIILEGKDNSDVEKLIDQVVSILTLKEKVKLGKAFNAIERIGYVRTSIRAYKMSNEKANEEQKVLLKKLACGVAPDQVRVLLDYAKIYPSVLAFLKANEGIIDQIFNDGEDDEIKTTFKEIENVEESKRKWRARNI